VRRVLDGGEIPARVAADLGVSGLTVRNWVRSHLSINALLGIQDDEEVRLARHQVVNALDRVEEKFLPIARGDVDDLRLMSTGGESGGSTVVGTEAATAAAIVVKVCELRAKLAGLIRPGSLHISQKNTQNNRFYTGPMTDAEVVEQGQRSFPMLVDMLRQGGAVTVRGEEVPA
jgi:hypothetical protein